VINVLFRGFQEGFRVKVSGFRDPQRHAGCRLLEADWRRLLGGVFMAVQSDKRIKVILRGFSQNYEG